METRDAIRSVVENIPGICQLKPEQEECLVHILNGGDVVALLPTGFGKSVINQLLPIDSEKLGRPKSGKAIIVIVSPLVALMDDQVKEAAKLDLCAAYLGVHNDREIMEGNFSLILDYWELLFNLQENIVTFSPFIDWQCAVWTWSYCSSRLNVNLY